MGIRAYPFESQDSTENDWTNLLVMLQEPGVDGAPGGGALAASLPGGLTVRFAAGRAFAHGYVLDHDGAEDTRDVPVGPASTTARVDRIVYRFDPGANVAHFHHLPGVAGAGVPPAITRTVNGVYDVKAYQVKVGANAAGLASDALIDEREWVSNRVRYWTTADRPTVAGGLRPGQIGVNLTSRRLEWNPLGADDGWQELVTEANLTGRYAGHPATGMGNRAVGDVTGANRIGLRWDGAQALLHVDDTTMGVATKSDIAILSDRITDLGG